MSGVTTITTLKKAREHFNKQVSTRGLVNSNFLDKLLSDYFSYQNDWVNFTDVKNDLNCKLHELYVKFSNEQIDVKVAIDCVVFNKLHDFLMGILRQDYCKEDEFHYQKCMELCRIDVGAEQFGAVENYAIPLIAPVVELANLDNHKSPLEKLQCLCTTYDLIFAELKSALIDIISKFSENEHEIPIINNIDIIPILMTVIIKSKLVHLYSNIYFVESFLGCLRENKIIRHVLNTFKEAITNLQNVTAAVLKPASTKIYKDLDLVKVIEITTNAQTKMQTNQVTPLDRYRLRISNLIVTSTNEYQHII